MTDTIRWGIIGTGDVADRKGGPALYLAKRSQLVAVTSRTRDRAEAFAERHGDPRVEDDVESMLRNDIDAVYVATHPNTHLDYVTRCAAAGKHVLCEKPMAMSPTEAEQMVTACQSHGVSLCVAFYRRSFPVVQQLRELLVAGRIGQPLSVHVDTYSPFASQDPHPWRLDPHQSGGGFVMDMGSHRFDLMAHLFGAPTEVRGILATQTPGWVVDDAAMVAFRFPEDVLGSARFHWNTPISRDSLTVVGTQGVVHIDDLSARGEMTLETPSQQESWSLPASSPTHLGLVEQFVHHLLDGEPNPNPCSSPGQDGAEVNRMMRNGAEIGS